MLSPQELLDNFNRLNIPTEEEIIANWIDPTETPKVSVLCITYNHKPYIEDALKGFLIQKTNFPFEIIIHDDASTDGTSDIIRDYAYRYPKLIKTIIQKENLYSQGISRNKYVNPLLTADYIALCEGDDFWIDEKKLQTQCDISTGFFEPSLLISPFLFKTNESLNICNNLGSHIKLISVQEILSNKGGPLGQTASYFMNKEIYFKVNTIFPKRPIGDLFLEVIASLEGKLIYYPKIFTLYRYAVPGSWSLQNFESKEKADNYKIFVNRMEYTIKESRKHKLYSDLNWDPILSFYYYRLAEYYLEEKKYRDFKTSICKNYHLKDQSLRQKIIYYFRNNIFLLKIILPTYDFFKKILKKTSSTNKYIIDFFSSGTKNKEKNYS